MIRSQLGSHLAEKMVRSRHGSHAHRTTGTKGVRSSEPLDVNGGEAKRRTRRKLHNYSGTKRPCQIRPIAMLGNQSNIAFYSPVGINNATTSTLRITETTLYSGTRRALKKEACVRSRCRRTMMGASSALFARAIDLILQRGRCHKTPFSLPFIETVFNFSHEDNSRSIGSTEIDIKRIR